jgi:hypothetical protein
MNYATYCGAAHQEPVLFSETSQHLHYTMNASKMHYTWCSNCPSTVGVGMMSRSGEGEMKSVLVLQNHQSLLLKSSGAKYNLHAHSDCEAIVSFICHIKY